jgi:uncharacterized protein (DUF2235 family)
MPKNIIFCADGTWNGPGQDHDDDGVADPTNVFKLFANLAGGDSTETLMLANEQERLFFGADGKPLQIAKYLHGVGDSSNFLVRALGGAGGAGLITRVVRGYTFISRNYVASDRIYLVGFSRGAYTARALAGLVAARGLLDAAKIDLDDRDKAYRLGSAEWFEWRRNRLDRNTPLLSRLQEIAFDLPGFLSRPPTAPRILDVPIAAVGVWDTVGALGIPQFNRDAMRLDAFQFADTSLSGKVKHGLHAIAVDERRADFTPTLWDADARIVQLLFPGAHSDIGGGYPRSNGQSGLSDGALEWMTEHLRHLEVLFAETPTFPASPDARALAHEPWARPPWALLPSGSRVFPAGLSLHRSIVARMGAGPVRTESLHGPYAPLNLGLYITAGRPSPGIVVM